MDEAAPLCDARRDGRVPQRARPMSRYQGGMAPQNDDALSRSVSEGLRPIRLTPRKRMDVQLQPGRGEPFPSGRSQAEWDERYGDRSLTVSAELVFGGGAKWIPASLA